MSALVNRSRTAAKTSRSLGVTDAPWADGTASHLCIVSAEQRTNLRGGIRTEHGSRERLPGAHVTAMGRSTRGMGGTMKGTMKAMLAVVAVLTGSGAFAGAGPAVGATPPATQCAPAADYPAASTPVAFWSTEARCAIVPSGPGGVFGTENFGNKF